MVNDLNTLQSDSWKYVDDFTITEIIPKYSHSNMQHELDHISNWCDLNYMKLNPKKCKELRVNFQRNLPSLPELSQLTINGTMIETVTNHKLLGLQIQDDLKWNAHVENITKKAAKRLYIIRILKRSGVPEDGLISVYISEGSKSSTHYLGDKSRTEWNFCSLLILISATYTGHVSKLYTYPSDYACAVWHTRLHATS